MKILKSGGDYPIELHASDDRYADKGSAKDIVLLSGARLLIRLSLFDDGMRRHVDEKAENKKIKKFYVLTAHGYVEKSEWLYTDGKRRRPVQGWIDEMDGKYAALFLEVCNKNIQKENIFEVRSKESLIFYPDNEFSVDGFRYGFCKIRFFDPENRNITVIGYDFAKK